MVNNCSSPIFAVLGLNPYNENEMKICLFCGFLNDYFVIRWETIVLHKTKL